MSTPVVEKAIEEADHNIEDIIGMLKVATDHNMEETVIDAAVAADPMQAETSMGAAVAAEPNAGSGGYDGGEGHGGVIG